MENVDPLAAQKRDQRPPCEKLPPRAAIDSDQTNAGRDEFLIDGRHQSHPGGARSAFEAASIQPEDELRRDMLRSADYGEQRTKCDNAELALRCRLVRVGNVNFAAQASSWLIRQGRSRAAPCSRARYEVPRETKFRYPKMPARLPQQPDNTRNALS